MKHTEGKWGCVYTSTKHRAVRSKGGIICTLVKPRHYQGQDQRYDDELEEARLNQKLIAAAPELLDALTSALIQMEDDLSAGTIDVYFIKERIKKAKQAIEKATKTTTT